MRLPIARYFLGQSSRSNYCAVYSTGMLLSLLGLATTRSAALRLFDLRRSNPDYSGATHFEIAHAFRSAASIKRCRWDYHKIFRFASVSKSLSAQLRDYGYPTLLTFGAIHKNGTWRCTHVVVAVAATERFIDVLDPLGKKPQELSTGNVRLQVARAPAEISVIGNSYTVDVTTEAFVLRW